MDAGEWDDYDREQKQALEPAKPVGGKGVRARAGEAEKPWNDNQVEMQDLVSLPK